MTKTYVIDGKSDGLTVKDFVRSHLGFSARALKNLKYHGTISVDGKEVFSNFLLKSGMTLILNFHEDGSKTIVPQEIPLDVIFEDDDFLAINKPHGMPSHPSQNHHLGTLANAVMYRYREIPFVYRVLTRLDIDTTGVVIIAKNAIFADGFQKCPVEKEYLAVCVGTPFPKSGCVDAPIGRADGIIKRCVTSSGKTSLTKYEVLAENHGLSLVRAIPVTGRTHQIRVHMAHIGCPLFGDYLYGTEIDGKRTHLHCRRLSFVHPVTKKEVVIHANIPDDFKALNLM